MPLTCFTCPLRKAYPGISPAPKAWAEGKKARNNIIRPINQRDRIACSAGWRATLFTPKALMDGVYYLAMLIRF
jgi:hypothetical protein